MILRSMVVHYLGSFVSSFVSYLVSGRNLPAGHRPVVYSEKQLADMARFLYYVY